MLHCVAHCILIKPNKTWNKQRSIRTQKAQSSFWRTNKPRTLCILLFTSFQLIYYYILVWVLGWHPLNVKNGDKFLFKIFPSSIIYSGILYQTLRQFMIFFYFLAIYWRFQWTILLFDYSWMNNATFPPICDSFN